jgi:hypothetical protein
VWKVLRRHTCPDEQTGTFWSILLRRLRDDYRATVTASPEGYASISAIDGGGADAANGRSRTTSVTTR